MHPWYLEDTDAAFAQLKDLARNPHVLAIGECGLDKVTKTPWKAQVSTFASQIQLANNVQKPLIIHCVRAYQECLATLKEYGNSVPVLFHGFAKSEQLADQLLADGAYLSLGHAILRGRHDDLLCALPLDRIFFETDSQDLQVAEIYHYFCAVRKIGLCDLAAQVETNFNNVFR